MDPEQIPLRDLRLPETIGWWPLAPGWWFVIVLLLVGLGFLLRLYLRTRARGAARRHALRKLNELTAEFETHHQASSEINDQTNLVRTTRTQNEGHL